MLVHEQQGIALVVVGVRMVGVGRQRLVTRTQGKGAVTRPVPEERWRAAAQLPGCFQINIDITTSAKLTTIHQPVQPTRTA